MVRLIIIGPPLPGTAVTVSLVGDDVSGPAFVECVLKTSSEGDVL